MEQQVPELERAKRLIRKMSERTTDRGCSESEAMEAAEKVGLLLQQFDLQLSDVFISEEICIQREFYAANDSFHSVVSGIARLCSLRHYRDVGKSGTTFVVFGFERDMELALYLYEVIGEAFNTEWATFTVAHGFARKTRESFELGFADRIWNRLHDIRRKRDQENLARVKASGSRDLVLVRDHIVDEEFEKTGVRLFNATPKRIHDGHAYRRGQDAGNRVQIHTPVNGDARSLLG